MADHHSNQVLPSDLDARDPKFPQQAVSLNYQTRCDIMEIIAATKKTLDQSKLLLAEADRMLGKT